MSPSSQDDASFVPDDASIVPDDGLARRWQEILNTLYLVFQIKRKCTFIFSVRIWIYAEYVTQAVSSGPVSSRLSNDGPIVPDDGVIVPDDGVIVPDDGVIVPDDGVIVSDDGVIVPDDGLHR
jgi:hypothetical protein